MARGVAVFSQRRCSSLYKQFRDKATMARRGVRDLCSPTDRNRQHAQGSGLGDSTILRECDATRYGPGDDSGACFVRPRRGALG